ncbi:MAG: DUF2066 domain-containing protein [Alphaproteobacteria bacterium]
MKSTPWAVLAALILTAVLCAFPAQPASAQAQSAQQTSLFTVSGVNVDETAANGSAAQQQGFASAARIGFQRLVARLTSPDERSRIAAPQPDAATLDRLVLSTDVEQERRSATHYVGRLTVRFDPAQVRALLRGAGFTLIEARTAPVLVAPVAASDTPADTAALWRDVWTNGGYGQELAPVAVAPDALTGAPAWTSAQPFAAAAGATSTLYAILRVQGPSLSATLTEVSAQGAVSRGTVTAQVNGTDAVALRAALQNLADQADAQVQNVWKARSVAGQPARSRVSATALYSDERQWEQIKQGLQGAATTLISEIRIEAVGRQGALISFTFTGQIDQLGAELNRRGVSLEQSPDGPVLRLVQSQGDSH